MFWLYYLMANPSIPLPPMSIAYKVGIGNVVSIKREK